MLSFIYFHYSIFRHKEYSSPREHSDLLLQGLGIVASSCHVLSLMHQPQMGCLQCLHALMTFAVLDMQLEAHAEQCD